MNIVQVQDQLKNFSQDQLVREMQSPTGNAPQYLVLSEIMRRQRMQQDFAAQKGKGDQGTVAQDAIAAAGVPQGGLASMASAMAPKTDMAASTGVQAMAAGGPVKKMKKGGAAMTDPAIRAMANRAGMTVEEYLRSVGEEQAAQLEQSAAARALRERMGAMEPQQDSGVGGVNPSYVEDLTGRFPVTGFSEPGPDYLGETTYDGSAPPSRPGSAAGANMTSVGEAIAAGKARGGKGGILDAMLASGTPASSGDMYLPPERLIPAAGTPEGQYTPLEAYYPGPAAATELNLPQLRAALGGAGLATGIRSAAENYVPKAAPVEPGAGRSGFPSVRTYTPEQLAAMEAAQPAPAPPINPMIAPVEPGAGRSGFATELPPPPEVPMSNRRAAYEIGRSGYNPLEGSAVGDFFSMLGGQTVEEKAAVEAARAAAEGKEPTKSEPPAGKDAADQPAAPASDTTSGGAVAGGTGSGGTGSGGTATGGTGSGGIAGAGGMSSYEQELMDALGRREKAANQDKWLALAQVGLNLMASTNPTIGGAIGEAGLKGVEAARAARDQYDKDRMDLMGALEQSRLARAAAVAKAARGGSGGKPINATILGQYMDQLAAAKEELALLGPVPEPSWWSGTIDDPNFAQRDAAENKIAALNRAIQYAYATHGAPYVGDLEQRIDGDVSD
jgi:hypothetical protein